MFRDRNIILGVSGGIAAYKAVELLRLLIREGSEVWTIMTRAATEFLRPLTFQALSGHPVKTDLFTPARAGEIEHIALADRADLMVVAPATANVVGKMAHGIADDMLTTTALASRCPLVVCPAMNVNMYNHQVVQDNLEILRSRGVWVVDPQEGELACGWEGKGRLADLGVIVETMRRALTPQDLGVEHILVTAGPTIEPIDPVRFVSNYSSGKMGYALARVARRRGAEVTLVSGPTHLTPPPGVRFVQVSSAQEMCEAVLGSMEAATVVIKAAAVSDYRPQMVRSEKIKKQPEGMSLILEKTPDILAEVGARRGDRLIVGFAADTGDILVHAREKLHKKNLDFVVANDLTQPGAGFGVDTNQVKILHRDGTLEELPQMTKEEVANAILDRVARLRRGGGSSTRTRG